MIMSHIMPTPESCNYGVARKAGPLGTVSTNTPMGLVRPISSYKSGYYMNFTTTPFSGTVGRCQAEGLPAYWAIGASFKVGRPFLRSAMLTALTATGAVAAVVSLNPCLAQAEGTLLPITYPWSAWVPTAKARMQVLHDRCVPASYSFLGKRRRDAFIAPNSTPHEYHN